MTQGPGIESTTPPGPRAHVPVWDGAAVAVGNENIGPTPQMMPPTVEGAKNNCSWMSPNPLARPASPTGKLFIGTIVRAMPFHPSVNRNGMAG